MENPEEFQKTLETADSVHYNWRLFWKSVSGQPEGQPGTRHSTVGGGGLTDSRAAGWWPGGSPGWKPETLLALLLASCGAAPANPGPEDQAEPTVHWGYEGDVGPDHWGDLDPSFAACSLGKLQSPVDLSNAREGDLGAVVFNYSPTRIHLKHDGHTVLADCETGDSIRFDKGTFDLVQFRIHRPSEHLIGGRRFPMEIQFLHRDPSDRLVMVAVLCQKGEPNRALETFSDSLPSRLGEQGYLGKAVPLQDLLPESRRAFRYEGSLTTPPCTEPVFWIVLAEPLEISDDQLAQFERAVQSNNRPDQPLNGRKIHLGE